MNVKLIAHTQLSDSFYDNNLPLSWDVEDSKVIALTAIRTCYSPLKPTKIAGVEGDRYFGKKAADGKGGSEADRLFRQLFLIVVKIYDA